MPGSVACACVEHVTFASALEGGFKFLSDSRTVCACMFGACVCASVSVCGALFTLQIQVEV